VHGHNRRLAELLNLDSEALELVSLTAWVTEADRPAFLTCSRRRPAAPRRRVSREFTLKIPERGARQFRCSTGWIRETGQIAPASTTSPNSAHSSANWPTGKTDAPHTLVGGIAHELNNKLTPVQGFAQRSSSNE